MEYYFKDRHNINIYNCVYIIKNIKTNKVYVGSAVALKKRIISHYSSLKCKNHHSGILQNSWLKYGENSFIIKIIEKDIVYDKLLEREQFFIDFYDATKNGYNILAIAGSNKGNKWGEDQKINYSKLKKSLELGSSVIQYSLSGEILYEYSSMKLAAEKLNIKNSSNIGLSCRKMRSHVNGFKWEYTDREKQKKYGFHDFKCDIIKCPHCQCDKTKKSGFTYWKDNKQQVYRCNCCNKRFNLKTKTENAWNVNIERNKKIIDLFNNKGLKINEIAVYLGVARITVTRVLKKNN